MQSFTLSLLLIGELRRWNTSIWLKIDGIEKNLINGGGTCPDVGFSIQDTFGPFKFGAMAPQI